MQESRGQTTRKSFRNHCEGMLPLDARVEPWMEAVFHDPQLFELVDTYDSPLNLVCRTPFVRNVSAFINEAKSVDLDFDVYFARKANKCLTFVDAAKEMNWGIDVASEVELLQVLERKFSTDKIICTAAIKTQRMVKLCVQQGVTIAIDNVDELDLVRRLTVDGDRQAKIAIRLSGFTHDDEKLHSRFGIDISDTLQFVSREIVAERKLRLVGLHFHLDGYSADHRIAALNQCVALVDQLNTRGIEISFIDMGGGIPMNYLENEAQWEQFWSAQKNALLGHREPLTYRNHGLGFQNIGGVIHGERKTYPFCQTTGSARWLAEVLNASGATSSMADELRQRSIQLRCEPGRSVLDGCGMTVARVEFRKIHPDGYSFIGLSMNRTQCRTSSADFLVDPILIRRSSTTARANGEAVEGYLVGAYCTESELLTLRRLQFANGIERGDLIIFPNTAGYFMHFLESRSHQFPLAANVVVDVDLKSFQRDEID